jgi:hypothetical protein
MPRLKVSTLALCLAALGGVAGCGLLTEDRAPQQNFSVAGSGPTPVSAGGNGGSAGQGPLPPSLHAVVGMQPLRHVEYRNSLQDLLGLDTESSLNDEPTTPFWFGRVDAGRWFEAVSKVAAQFFAQPSLPEPFACVNAGGAERACALGIIDKFGLRAFRRPLLPAEQQSLVTLYDQVISLGASSREALEQVLCAVLMSPAFVFHLELSDDPDGTAPERLDSYALAARLSFALWSTTPDAELLDAAAGDLTSDAALSAAYARLSQSPRATALADGLGDVWLNLDRIQYAAPYPLSGFTEGLRSAMLDEERAFFRLFATEPHPLRDLLTLDVNFVDETLAAHYGMPAPPGPLTRVSVTTDERRGQLGLSGLLTMTSHPTRTSPTQRGYYIMLRRLCSPPPPPPADVPKLDLDQSGAPSSGDTTRAQITFCTQDEPCHACHRVMDPPGFALGNFDLLGRFTTTDGALGNPVDVDAELSSSLFPPGADTHVHGLTGLTDAIASNAHFHACAAQNLAQYMIHREITEKTDADLLVPLSRLVSASATLPDVSQAVVMSDAFRYRRQAPSAL